MTPAQTREAEPTSAAQAAEMLRMAADAASGVRIVGGATKLGWGAPCGAEPRISSRRLDRILEHNAGDFTLVTEAGTKLAAIQHQLRSSRQRIALDPSLGAHHEATVGGIVAAGDSGPLRHRYGTARDLILGIAVALPDGAVAKSGGKVIKNVAGYDLAKLYTGSFGTLGMIVRVAMRLHPLPERTLTVRGEADEIAPIAAAVRAMTRAPLEPEAVDVSWCDGRGTVLVQLAGSACEPLAGRTEALLAAAGLATDRIEDDEAVWEAQRAAQRSERGTIVRVSSVPLRLADVLELVAERDLSLVGRAVVGTSWITIPEGPTERAIEEIAVLRQRLSPSICALMDAPPEVRRRVDVWGFDSPGEQRLMAAVRQRFDPAARCNPGLLDGVLE